MSWCRLEREHRQMTDDDRQQQITEVPENQNLVHINLDLYSSNNTLLVVFVRKIFTIKDKLGVYQVW